MPEGWRNPTSEMRNLSRSPVASRIARVVCCAVLLLCAGNAAAADAAGAEDGDVYMGVRIDPTGGTFEAVSNANLRAAPKPDARTLGILRRGIEVEVVGRKGQWLAVRSEGEDIGFVFEPLLKIVVLPPLTRDAQGRVLDEAGQPITPATGSYMVKADVNIRSEPSSNATKRGQIEAGRKVVAFGAAKNGEWLAVRRDGKELGFVAADVLVPLIDGRLAKPLSGESAPTPLASCRYAVRFAEKGAVQDETFQTSDYDVDWRCVYAGEKLDFYGFMFITEAPVNASGPPVYQISLDLFEVEVGYDESFSTVFLYDRDKGTVTFDSVNIERFGAEPKIRQSKVADVRAALSAAAMMAPSAWSTDLWDSLLRKQQGGG